MNDLEIHARKPSHIWANNPALIQLLGLSPLLAVSSTLAYGIGLGMATLCVCVFSCLTTSVVKPFISQRWRLVWYMVILASYTTVVDTLAQLYFYPLYLRLGIYVPLICCNAAILVRMETVAAHSNYLQTTLDAIKVGVGFLLALVLFSACREILITGSLLSNWQILLPSNEAYSALSNAYRGSFFRFAETQAGAFILLGLVVALSNLASAFARDSAGKRQDPIAPAKRARVTGRLIPEDGKELSEK